LRVFVTDPVHPEQLYARVSERFPHALVVQHAPAAAAVAPERRAVTAETDPLEVARDFVAYATGGEASEAEVAVLGTAYEAALASETSA
ncbi:MAG: exonuclease sbcCD subunit, partial [Frondihabitans sp.]|nr:exonuclease sbcCD subunit [Frondihabitans sp.]